MLGTGLTDGVEEIRELIVDEVGGFIDPLLNERLLGILSTKENVNLETLGFVNDIKKYTAIITPIDIAESGSEHCLCTGRMIRMILMILF